MTEIAAGDRGGEAVLGPAPALHQRLVRQTELVGHLAGIDVSVPRTLSPA